MIKRTLFFSNPAYLSHSAGQLIVKYPQNEKPHRSVPIEDVGFVVLDNPQLTISLSAMESLISNNVAVVVCDRSHMPVGLHLPLCGNTLQSERFQCQISASLPLKKQLWQQTVQAKIQNQAALLKTLRSVETGCMMAWAKKVRSGDPDNLEGRAAAYYWGNFFPAIPWFTRDRYGIWPNSALNYGYAILRAIVARSLVASGLLPTLGIHHHNRYNAYCLADDIMEPYRPYVDRIVASMADEETDSEIIGLTPALKQRFLSLPVEDVWISGSKRPLMNAVSATTTSLYRCYSGEQRKIVYPEINISNWSEN